MRSAFALRINSGNKFFNFGIAELLRALRYPIFTGEVVAGNYIYSKKLPLHREMRGEFLFTTCYLFLYIS